MPAFGNNTTSTGYIDLPPGWEKRWDLKTKRYYFVDHNTQTTHWEAPSAQPEMQENAQVQFQLPQGWEQKFDTQSGKYYYVDHNTQSTHWEIPQFVLSYATTLFFKSICLFVLWCFFFVFLFFHQENAFVPFYKKTHN